MGFWSRSSPETRKDAAAAAIEAYFTLGKKYGVFHGDPAKSARLIVAFACAQEPGLPKGQHQPLVLAVTCLALMLMEPAEPLEIREQFAMALVGMLKAADTYSKPYSIAEQKYLEFGELIYSQFRARYPSPPMTKTQLHPVTPKSSMDTDVAMDRLAKVLKQ